MRWYWWIYSAALFTLLLYYYYGIVPLWIAFLLLIFPMVLYFVRDFSRNMIASSRTHHVEQQLDAIRIRDATTESPLEHALAAALNEKGIPYVREYRISNMHVDFAFLQAKVAVECDGWRYHHDRKEHDAARDRTLSEQGWTVLRFTGEEIRKDIDACVRKISEKI